MRGSFAACRENSLTILDACSNQHWLLGFLLLWLGSGILC
jgi:hypothetical protein